ncbi:uncharacterized protein LOC62_02G002594 [Vanrija pseudolonga]|uniref:RNase III domain-containing protein n=1 Tax=Vanrija pseudolonga TaxID=143232 RepID=A0AAF0Y2X2_9TREE|nr:hypothetical protein LOC62_02G002594 [Vanrija pseudolonga]
MSTSNHQGVQNAPPAPSVEHSDGRNGASFVLDAASVASFAGLTGVKPADIETPDGTISAVDGHSQEVDTSLENKDSTDMEGAWGQVAQWGSAQSKKALRRAQRKGKKSRRRELMKYNLLRVPGVKASGSVQHSPATAGEAGQLSPPQAFTFGTEATFGFAPSLGFSAFVGFGRPPAALPETTLGQAGSLEGGTVAPQDGSAALEGSEAPVRRETELEMWKRIKIGQLETRVKVQRTINEKLQKDVNKFKAVWSKASPRYSIETALVDMTQCKGRMLRKRMAPAKGEDPELTDCTDGSCRCVASRRDRAQAPIRGVNNWASPPPCGHCDCCNDAMVPHVAANLPVHLVPQLPESMGAPEIQHEVQLARTHPTFVADLVDSYKDLEHVGDSVVELSVRVMMIMAADSCLPRGYYRSRLKRWCVANSTLALLSKHWDLIDRVRIDPETRNEIDETKLRGDLAESHIGVMFKTHGWDATSAFLRDVYTPIIDFLVEEMDAQRLA